MLRTWHQFAPWKNTTAEEFHNSNWQDRNAVIRPQQLRAALDGVVHPTLYDEIETGLLKVGMAIRLNPYIISMIDWSSAETDPVRRQSCPWRPNWKTIIPTSWSIPWRSRIIRRCPASSTAIPTRSCSW